MEVYKGKSPEQGMRAEIVYRSKKKEVVHSIRVYPNLYLCIIANPAKEGEARYLRAVELKDAPIPAVTTRMFKEAPFGYMSQREAVFLPKDEGFEQVIHPLLLEPFPDELCMIKGEVLMRRRMGEKEFLYECTMKEIKGLSFPVIEEYSREVEEEKDTFIFKDILLE
jgi:hypothetical protein